MMGIKLCMLFTICGLALVESEPTPADDKILPTNCGKGTRIIGGVPAVKNSSPWQVAIYFMDSQKRTFFCGGSLINQAWVMTAAHCTKDENGRTITKENFEIRLGAHNLTLNGPDGIAYGVSKVVPHPSYNSRRIANDIALLKLDKRVDLNDTDGKIGAVCLANKEIYKDGDTVTVTGWGTTKETSTNFPPSDVLMTVDINVVPEKQCEDTMNTYINIFGIKIPIGATVTEKNVCAGMKGKGGCQGDSGGPLVIKKEETPGATVKSYEIGVVSWGDSNCESITVFTKVQSFYDWIVEQIKR